MNLENLLQEWISQPRYEHTLRVTALALELAKNHNLNLDETYQAAMLHDLTKEKDQD